MASGHVAGQSVVKAAGDPSRKPKRKLNPNKSPPLPDHLKNSIGEIEECETPVLPEHYVIVDDLRYVIPYHFDFRLHAKKRMVGVPLVDLFSTEFPVRPRCFPGGAAAHSTPATPVDTRACRHAMLSPRRRPCAATFTMLREHTQPVCPLFTTGLTP